MLFAQAFNSVGVATHVYENSGRHHDALHQRPSTLRRRREASPRIELRAKLWDRLEIEDDLEPNWYLINCVAGLEMDLLKQCRDACADLPDAIKFAVPTEKKTRSHGANRMVTEKKVKYQGYVFAKLRLCSDVYETIQSLDLCRSWMGTVNQKGHKKLPPAPCPLNELEIEDFGLEEYEDEDETEDEEDFGGVILDTPDRKPKLDADAIKAYLGLEVDNMIKVTARGKFFNEDGIVRRLKDGKILVRLYTYGSMYEEWMDPKDVRKLSSMEILKGLSGPSQPVTRSDFERNDRRNQFGNDRRGSSDLRRSFMVGNGPRNRRQDRNERNFRRDRNSGRTNDERRNWNWYQDQQRSRGADDVTDGQVGMNAASRRDQGGDWAIGSTERKWGRNSAPQPRQNRERRFDGPRNNKRDNRQATAAIEGNDDWSAFVSSPSSSSEKPKSSNGSDDDDFFTSLMGELSKDGKPSDNVEQSDDDFFDSLLSDLKGQENSSVRRNNKNGGKRNDEDFFASLEAELGSVAPVHDSIPDNDDFFEQLEAEVRTPKKPNEESLRSAERPPKAKVSSATTEDEDLFSGLLSKEATIPFQSNDVADNGVDPPQSRILDEIVAHVDDVRDATENYAQTSKKSSKHGRSPTESHPPTSASAGMETATLSKHTVPVLKDMLRKRGLKVSGKKAELIDRLMQESI